MPTRSSSSDVVQACDSCHTWSAQCRWMAVISSSRVPLCMSRSLCTALYRRREAVCTWPHQHLSELNLISEVHSKEKALCMVTLGYARTDTAAGSKLIRLSSHLGVDWK